DEPIKVLARIRLNLFISKRDELIHEPDPGFGLALAIETGEIVHDQTCSRLDRNVLHLLLVTERNTPYLQRRHQMIGVQVELISNQDCNLRRWQLLSLYPAFNQASEIVSLLTTIFEVPGEYLAFVSGKLL